MSSCGRCDFIKTVLAEKQPSNADCIRSSVERFIKYMKADDTSFLSLL